ncbi:MULTISPECIES: hypothetical protein [unclassified Corynebacterium]|uniref:hypothetical protein n=1 Tax=unclassified Corynebacterium TaxID=2624378 RepID=UPI0029CA9D05|nr:MULTISPECIES: hypothetical protein [unclassified Corynebacterium]WPF65957.1 hypothetical protein OLX12_10445 [Corynebacterium sp. 22KM0430]WPF68450.1 hypothetical protein OLW90_10440 [Corynebacterium sp. 21KM1197]
MPDWGVGEKMDWDLIIRVGQLAIAVAGFVGVMATVRQKAMSDRRSEWWRRYAWAMEQVNAEHVVAREAGWTVLTALSEGRLATRTERGLIWDQASLMKWRGNVGRNDG